MAAQEKYHEQFKGALHSMTQDLIQVISSFEEVKLEMVEMKCAIKEVQKTVNQVLSDLPLLLKSALPPDSSSLHHQAESSASKCFQLHFQGKLPNTLLTKNQIEDEGASLTVELCDDTGKRVEVDPGLCLKNMKVKFSVLDGDFDIKDRDHWTEDDFKMNIATPRKDKAPLLKGNSEVSLSKGAARVCGISFTDNSRSTTKNGSFRLGAQITRGLPSGWVVKPAVSEAFQVKESRLKSDQKHATPSPTDELYRLKNINRTGAVYCRALDHGVVTVMDFLQLYHTDPKKMQKILKITGIKWEETVKNAKACNLTSESYKLKYQDEATGDILLLNCDFNIESVTFMGQTSQPYESLEVSQKEKIDNLRKCAYEKRKELRKIYDSTNQSLVQAGFSRLTYLSSVQQEQEQQQSAPTPTFNIDSNVSNLVGFSDLICSNPCTNPYLGTTSAYQDSCQQNFINIPASLTTDAYGVHETDMGVENDSSVAYNYPTEQVVVNRLDSQQVSDITVTNQVSCQQDVMAASGSLITGDYAGDNSSVAYEFQTEQVADNGADLPFTAANQAQSVQQMLNDPSAYWMWFEPSDLFSDINYENYDEMEMHNPSANMVPTQSFRDIGIENAENTDPVGKKKTIELKWCKVTVVQLGISRWKKRRGGASCCRAQKRQRTESDFSGSVNL